LFILDLKVVADATRAIAWAVPKRSADKAEYRQGRGQLLRKANSDMEFGVGDSLQHATAVSFGKKLSVMADYTLNMPHQATAPFSQAMALAGRSPWW
jgi:hypothetical protein